MNDQPGNEDNWSELTCTPSVVDPPPEVLGFLQLCADRRFHRCIQRQFQIDADISSPEEYWIHADAGGTPTMVDNRAAPDYCYDKKYVQKMGWSAHGEICGGFPNNPGDAEIRRLLLETVEIQRARYPRAEHYVYFATSRGAKDAEAAVVYCMKYEKASD